MVFQPGSKGLVVFNYSDLSGRPGVIAVTISGRRDTAVTRPLFNRTSITTDTEVVESGHETTTTAVRWTCKRRHWTCLCFLRSEPRDRCDPA